MKKVLLVTLWDDKNFGNRLQAIALKHMIDEMGYQAVSMPNTSIMPIDWRIKQFVKCFFGKIGVKKYRYANLRKIRTKALKESSYELLSPMAHYVYNFEPNNYLSPEYYYASIVGSDQVWHKWTHYPKELEFFYLRFMPEYKRIAYAASFGFESFPKEDLTKHVEGLSEMHFISCREKSGCELVSNNTRKKASLVLDPTLCVERDFWDSIEQKPAYDIKNKYIFVMILGQKGAYYSIIEDYAKRNNLDIIDIMDPNYKDIWKTTIGNFIWLVHNAFLVCTDSFHCTVFSILFKKRVTIFHRLGEGFENMYDRIKTLLDMCDLQMCEFDGVVLNDELPDYKLVKERLTPMVKYSNQWLKDALNSVEEKN